MTNEQFKNSPIWNTPGDQNGWGKHVAGALTRLETKVEGLENTQARIQNEMDKMQGRLDRSNHRVVQNYHNALHQSGQINEVRREQYEQKLEIQHVRSIAETVKTLSVRVKIYLGALATIITPFALFLGQAIGKHVNKVLGIE